VAEFAPRRPTEESRRNVDRWLAEACLRCTPPASEAGPGELVLVTLAPEPESELAASPPAPPTPAAPPSRLGRMRRPASLVLAVVGVLLVAEFAITLAWREPISALRAAGGQSDLDKRLARLERQGLLGGAERTRSGKPKSLSSLAAGFRAQAKDGSPVGRLWIPEIDLKQVVVAGTAPSDLQRGPGYYSTSPFPGEGGTVALAGHRTTFTAPFRHLNDVKVGDDVRLHTPYGRFVYRVTSRQILDPSQAKVLRNAGYRRLVLTTCHPLFSQAQRLVVVAKQVLALRQDGYSPPRG
jgi:sortase A